MSESNQNRINSLLERCQKGDAEARDELFQLLHPELKRIAGFKLYGRSQDITVQATEVINELYIKFSRSDSFPDKSRTYFFSIAATAIEQIIIDYARRKKSLRRGGNLQRMDIDEDLLPAHETLNLELLNLGQLLHQLRQIDSQASSVFSARLFTDMTSQEISTALEVSERTVRRKWAFAKSYIHHNMQSSN